ncbi:MAG: response regulator transcription factor [Spirochaetaceae bacterium]
MALLSSSDRPAVHIDLVNPRVREAIHTSLSGYATAVERDDLGDTSDRTVVHIHDAPVLETMEPGHIVSNVPRLLLYDRLHTVLLERAVHRGFRGFLSLELVPDRVCEAVSFLASGQAFLDHDALQILLDRNGTVARGTVRHDESALDELTPRERQVFEALVRGQSLKEIGEAFGISERTVEVHRRRILERLGLSNVVQLFHLAFQAGIVTSDELLLEFPPQR